MSRQDRKPITESPLPDGMVWWGLLIVLLFLAQGVFFTVAHLLPDDSLNRDRAAEHP